MISNGGILGASSAGGFLDAGIYSSSSNGRGHFAVSYYLNKRATISFWYRNDYANTIGTMMWGNYHGSQDHTGMWVGGDGYVYHWVKYNNSMYHNVKSSSQLSTAQRATNTWHHFCMISPGNANIKVYIDGTKMLDHSENDYTDIFSGYWGYHSGWDSNISSLTGSPSWSHKGPTYVAQFAVVTGESPGTISEFINSDGTPIDFMDIDGSGTVLDTQRANPENASEGNGIWLFGANGTTASKTHNSATDSSHNSGSLANWNGGDSNFALSTDTSVFPITGITT